MSNVLNNLKTKTNTKNNNEDKYLNKSSQIKI